MTTRTWNGSNAAYTTAADWSPTGVPVSGDLAVINSGTVGVGTSDLASGLTLQITAASAATEVDLNGTTIQATDRINMNAAAAQVVLGASGTVTNQGVIVMAASGAFNPILGLVNGSGGAASTFVNSGTIDLTNSIVQFNNFGSNTSNQMINNGLISMTASAGLSEELFSSLNINGSGTIQVGPGYRYETTGSVGSGQKVVMESSGGHGSVLAIDFANGFKAPVYGLTASDTVFITTPQYNSYTASFANGVTTVTLNGSTSSVGAITLVGNYTSNLSVASAVDPSSGFEQTRLTTSLPDSSGTSGEIGVYRFFDTLFGTHFFTSNAGEVANVLATRPDLVEETNDFGAVDPNAQDPTAIPVYRFFDTIHGTHFFTASAAEAQTVQATRPDLTYEPSSTFYEHATPEAGDVAVFRFFDSKLGTHFYTGDQNEFNAITTPGTSTFRSDLVYEGVGFYAPSGSFTGNPTA